MSIDNLNEISSGYKIDRAMNWQRQSVSSAAYIAIVVLLYMFEIMFSCIYLLIIFFHAVSRYLQGRQREPSVKTLRSPLSAEFWRHCVLSGRTQRRMYYVEFDPHLRKWNIYLHLHLYFYFFALVSWQSAALSSDTQYVMSSKLGGKWGTKCLNTEFPLSTLLCEGYNVKLIFYLF